VSARIRLRRATPADVDFLVELATHSDVAPYLAAVSPRDAGAFRAELEAADAAPAERGRYVIEHDGRPAGTVAFFVANRRSAIAHLHGLMLDPAMRGRGLAREATRAFARHVFDDLGFHRIELECYGFNERAIRHFEACGFTREGVKRQAYRRGDGWVDGVLFGALAQEIK
jgi:RimJ/RimL family protein N-acetyltransferase